MVNNKFYNMISNISDLCQEKPVSNTFSVTNKKIRDDLTDTFSKAIDSGLMDYVKNENRDITDLSTHQVRHLSQLAGEISDYLESCLIKLITPNLPGYPISDIISLFDSIHKQYGSVILAGLDDDEQHDSFLNGEKDVITIYFKLLDNLISEVNLRSKLVNPSKKEILKHDARVRISMNEINFESMFDDCVKFDHVCSYVLSQVDKFTTLFAQRNKFGPTFQRILIDLENKLSPFRKLKFRSGDFSDNKIDSSDPFLNNLNVYTPTNFFSRVLYRSKTYIWAWFGKPISEPLLSREYSKMSLGNKMNYHFDSLVNTVHKVFTKPSRYAGLSVGFALFTIAGALKQNALQAAGSVIMLYYAFRHESVNDK